MWSVLSSISSWTSIHPSLSAHVPSVQKAPQDFVLCTFKKILNTPNRASHMAIVVKNLRAGTGNPKDEDSIPRLGRSPGGGVRNLVLFSRLEDSTDRRIWWATVHGVGKRVEHDWAQPTYLRNVWLYHSFLLWGSFSSIVGFKAQIFQFDPSLSSQVHFLPLLSKYTALLDAEDGLPLCELLWISVKCVPLLILFPLLRMLLPPLPDELLCIFSRLSWNVIFSVKSP